MLKINQYLRAKKTLAFAQMYFNSWDNSNNQERWIHVDIECRVAGYGVYSLHSRDKDVSHELSQVVRDHMQALGKETIERLERDVSRLRSEATAESHGLLADS